MSLDEFSAHVRALSAQRRLHFYLIADAAQDPGQRASVQQAMPDLRSRCLLTYGQGPDLEAAAPHLIALPPFDTNAPVWQWVVSHGAAMPAASTVVASPLPFEPLYEHLHSLTDVVLPDGDEMILAFWDPAILGTLVGQPDDATLHVRGPVLSVQQCARFLAGIAAWWYWDRGGKVRHLRAAESEGLGVDVNGPMELTQTQVDMLVEASVPDHVIGYIRSNKPELLLPIPEAKHYERVEKHLLEARRLHLFGMRDIVNYVCAALIYGDRMYQNSTIQSLMQKVGMGQLSLDQALEQFP